MLLKKRRSRQRVLSFFTWFCLIVLIAIYLLFNNAQTAFGSRKFLTGLIIGTLLARNGMQSGPSYPTPVAHYGGGSSHSQQQPLFIIIPSTGKANKPQLLPADSHYAPAIVPETSSGEYVGAESQHHQQRSYHPHRRSFKLKSISKTTTGYNHRPPPMNKASKLFKKLGLELSRADQQPDNSNMLNPSSSSLPQTLIADSPQSTTNFDSAHIHRRHSNSSSHSSSKDNNNNNHRATKRRLMMQEKQSQNLQQELGEVKLSSQQKSLDSLNNSNNNIYEYPSSSSVENSNFNQNFELENNNNNNFFNEKYHHV